DVTFDESVSYYRLFPYRTASLPTPPLFLAPGTPPFVTYVRILIGYDLYRIISFPFVRIDRIRQH
ncbi:unnamed protein product, partial [Closterium sp. NIES-54]